MMAMIIPTTAVARDAFEIGYIRWLESEWASTAHLSRWRRTTHFTSTGSPDLLGWIVGGALACGSLSVPMSIFSDVASWRC